MNLGIPPRRSGSLRARAVRPARLQQHGQDDDELNAASGSSAGGAGFDSGGGPLGGGDKRPSQYNSRIDSELLVGAATTERQVNSLGTSAASQAGEHVSRHAPRGLQTELARIIRERWALPGVGALGRAADMAALVRRQWTPTVSVLLMAIVKQHVRNDVIARFPNAKVVNSDFIAGRSAVVSG